MMKVEELDVLLVPLGLGLMGIYHVWLVFTVKLDPRRTVIGLNAESRRQWIFSLMAVRVLSPPPLSVLLPLS